MRRIAAGARACADAAGLVPSNCPGWQTANLLETPIGKPSRIQQVGKYYDLFERSDGRLPIRERSCVYDPVVINNCLVFPG